MRSLFQYLIVLQILTLSLYTPSFAQQDSLISFDDIEFTDGSIESGDDTLLEVPDDLIFGDGIASKEVDGGTAGDTPMQHVDASGAEQQSLWGIFIAGLLGGFAAFIMPCIFPMVPLTVSFFTKKGGSRTKGVSQALLYGLFIIVIYVALGMLITIAFGSDALNALSTNGFFNFLFFLILVVFAASFFGAFELTLPSSFVNKID